MLLFLFIYLILFIIIFNNNKICYIYQIRFNIYIFIISYFCDKKQIKILLILFEILNNDDLNYNYPKNI